MTHPLENIRFKPEKDLVEELFERFSLEALVQHRESNGEIEPVHDFVLSTQLRLTPILAPRLSALFEEVRTLLKFDEPVDLFVHSDADVNGFSLHSSGEGKPHVVSLTSGMVERMTDDELRFVMGHEIGHLFFRHHRPRLVTSGGQEGSEGESRIPPLLSRRLESWERMAELSADRAGFIGVEGRLEAIVSAFFKLASGLGPEHLRFDIDAFLAQLNDLQQMKRRDVLARFSHPATPVRVRALQIFAEEGGMQMLNARRRRRKPTAHPERKRKHVRYSTLDKKVAELARLMEYEVTEELEVQARDFLVSAGLLAAYADQAEMSREEHAILVELLLPLSSDPEAQLATVRTQREAEAMVERTAQWLRDNAGEERYLLYRQLAHLVSVDGVIHPGEKDFMLEVAEKLAIPEKSATEMLYEVLSEYLQSRTWGDPTGFRPRSRKKKRHTSPPASQA